MNTSRLSSRSMTNSTRALISDGITTFFKE